MFINCPLQTFTWLQEIVEIEALVELDAEAGGSGESCETK
jgi:hypothetical protein